MQYFGYNAEGYRASKADGLDAGITTSFQTSWRKEEAAGKGKRIFIRYKEKCLCCKEKRKAKVKRNAYHCELDLSKASWYKINTNDNKHR